MRPSLASVVRSSWRRTVAVGAAAVIALAIALLILADTERQRAPEDVALKYRQAIYASDANVLWRLLSSDDRRAKDRAAYRREHPEHRGISAEAVRLLASYITAAPVTVSIAGDRARVTLSFRLPDASAPAIRALMRNWQDDELIKLSIIDQARIASRIIDLHRQGKLPMVADDETIDLVRESRGWKVLLGWEHGMRDPRRNLTDEGHAGSSVRWATNSKAKNEDLGEVAP